MESEYVEQMQKQRKEKDRFFKNHPQSPLPQNHKETFSGLSYYPVDPALQFILSLKEHENKETIRIEDSKGGIQSFLRWGQFTFQINDVPYVLQAYKSNPNDSHLWIPFRDATNNKETYGAGRYIDLTEGNDTIDNQWILDFNLAYNPFCAYSENYVCPFIPPENWLERPINAGEKLYNESEKTTDVKLE
ncbi:MAG: DUF1684 domain-containing protein [Candidatus Thermoplasmatota archaeon]|nr:DUF1684 domain-containing protein [Candidatus Thermoplasmatota archaeon]